MNYISEKFWNTHKRPAIIRDFSQFRKTFLKIPTKNDRFARSEELAKSRKITDNLQVLDLNFAKSVTIALERCKRV